MDQLKVCPDSDKEPGPAQHKGKQKGKKKLLPSRKTLLFMYVQSSFRTDLFRGLPNMPALTPWCRIQKSQRGTGGRGTPAAGITGPPGSRRMRPGRPSPESSYYVRGALKTWGRKKENIMIFVLFTSYLRYIRLKIFY